VIIAPAFAADAVEILGAKKNVRSSKSRLHAASAPPVTTSGG